MITLKLVTHPVRFPAEIPDHRKGKFPGCRRLWHARDEQRAYEGRALTKREAIADIRPAEERVS